MAVPQAPSAPMQQLMLDVRPEVPATLENFVTGNNAALLEALRRQVANRDGSWLYLWGKPGSGITHLLRAAVAEAQAAGRPAQYLSAAEASALQVEPESFLAVDDLQALDDAAQAALFRALIQGREAGASLVLAGKAPPQQLALREDVRTRVGQALVFEVQALADLDLGTLLMVQAAARGFLLQADIIEYLLRRGRRDTHWLMQVLEALDEASLRQSRPVTLPLLREVLRDDGEPGQAL